MADPADSQAQASGYSVAHGSTANGSIGDASPANASTANASTGHGSTAGGDVALTRAATSNGNLVSGSRRDSQEIVAEIERTRQNLARTIDTLADRVSPASNVRRLKEQAAQELAKPEVQLAAAAIALAVTGLVIYRIWGRRRRG